jgi:hypothetical protein
MIHINSSFLFIRYECQVFNLYADAYHELLNNKDNEETLIGTLCFFFCK